MFKLLFGAASRIRNPFICIFLSLIAVNSLAQNIDCEYESIPKVSDAINQMEDANMRNLVIQKLKGQRKIYSVKYSSGKYLYSQMETGSNDNGVLQVGSSSSIYIDLAAKQQVSQANILDRTFLIKDTLKTYSWQIGQEQQSIQNMLCRKATLKEDSTVTAWFTLDIPVGVGPDGYYGLPGLVIRLETKGYIYNIQKIVLPEEPLTLVPPTKGKEISKEEFDKLKKEKLQQFGGDEGTSGGVKILKM